MDYFILSRKIKVSNVFVEIQLNECRWSKIYFLDLTTRNNTLFLLPKKQIKGEKSKGNLKQFIEKFDAWVTREISIDLERDVSSYIQTNLVNTIEV